MKFALVGAFVLVAVFMLKDELPHDRGKLDEIEEGKPLVTVESKGVEFRLLSMD